MLVFLGLVTAVLLITLVAEIVFYGLKAVAYVLCNVGTALRYLLNRKW